MLIYTVYVVHAKQHICCKLLLLWCLATKVHLNTVSVQSTSKFWIVFSGLVISLSSYHNIICQFPWICYTIAWFCRSCGNFKMCSSGFLMSLIRESSHPSCRLLQYMQHWFPGWAFYLLPFLVPQTSDNLVTSVNGWHIVGGCLLHLCSGSI